ncbi:hypothetical protein M407DRAFT_22680 [Tulasnella calospora MUT 4182]|uniref:DNA polymerase kappa n=1 Tax=Tulasnella calospora MUT 4182 TaxID=1051891 RepID=A0A0C3L2S7_9AGAM|nr:hypothetical protein M407DRAFT_22680 [Tulasnella calospora MUT 4182]
MNGAPAPQSPQPPSASKAAAFTDSLAHRLAGQSVGKAGLARDQTEISRIIAEASVGSKFYENERKKDEELTAKIESLKRKKDDLLKEANLVEASADRLVAEIEATRDLSQTIVHFDCDAFYASVEMLDDPSLIGKPFGVSPGVLTTASYEARKYGVRSAMPGFIAKKLCPQLILVPLHFERYSEMSEQVMSILRTRDPNMATVSVDEAYLNITEYCQTHDLSPEECVNELRAEVHEKTKLTVSAGIAPNKMLAKICSDRNKPNGQYYLPFEREAIVSFMAELPIRKVPGIGKVSERLLQSFGINTCGDIYRERATISVMDHWLGLHGLLQAYLGIASNDVHPGRREERKSVGSETTFHATSNVEELFKKLEKCAESLAEDLQEKSFAGRTVTLKYKLDTFKLFTRAKSCGRYVSTKEDLLAIGKELFLKENASAKQPLKLRLIGLQVSKLKDLRVDEEKGIMKFFSKSPGSKTPTSDASAKKRRKLDDDAYIVISSDNSGDEAEEEVDAAFLESPGPHRTGSSPPPRVPKPKKDNFFDSSDSEVDDDDGLQTRGAGPSRVAIHIQPPSSSPEDLLNAGNEIMELDDDERGAEGRVEKPKPASRLAVPKTGTGEAAKRDERGMGNKVTLSEALSISPEPRKGGISPKSSPNLTAKPTTPIKPQSVVCPICNRSLETDNAGLNSHIDFCLSRGIIKQASAEGDKAPVTPKRKVGSEGNVKSAPLKGKGPKSGGLKRPNPFAPRR